uniref:Uncharacterized protein n=1 Tax=uncultured marine microorganism HF4000_010I05 TaxID=455517 RepID=B3T1K1_9ZZZZ|nr:hypothetical protein ALOHA_HF4000010I05ctg1g24 [uncultured marine microorganism HF4000_010I05]
MVSNGAFIQVDGWDCFPVAQCARQADGLLEFDSTLPLQQLDIYRRELVETRSVVWLMAA